MIPTVWVSRLETVFGAVCWHLLTVCFQHDVEKILVFYGYIQIWWEIWQYIFVARFGCPITTPNLLHFGLKFLFWKLSEDVRTRCCQRIWTTLHNQKPKYAIQQKKRLLRVKPTENCPYGFPCIIIFNMSISPSKVNLTGRSSLWPRLRGRRWAAPPHLCWPSAAGVASHGPGLRRAAAVSWSHGTWEVNLGRFSLTIIGGYGDNDEQIELNNMG